MAWTTPASAAGTDLLASRVNWPSGPDDTNPQLEAGSQSGAQSTSCCATNCGSSDLCVTATRSASAARRPRRAANDRWLARRRAARSGERPVVRDGVVPAVGRVRRAGPRPAAGGVISNVTPCARLLTAAKCFCAVQIYHTDPTPSGRGWPRVAWMAGEENRRVLNGLSAAAGQLTVGRPSEDNLWFGPKARPATRKD